MRRHAKRKCGRMDENTDYTIRRENKSKRKSMSITSVTTDDENPNLRAQKSWLVRTLEAINRTYTPPTSRSKFKFENNTKAAIYNTRILQKYGYDVEKMVKEDRPSIVQPGSEF